MDIKIQLKKYLTGLTVPKEYCCVELEKLSQPLSVFLELKDPSLRMDITNQHLFLGYKPLVIGLSFSFDDPHYEMVRSQDEIRLKFSQVDVQAMDNNAPPCDIACLILTKIGEKIVDDHSVLLYEGAYGYHAFLNPLQQFVNRQRDRIRNRPHDNVGLRGNLADQIRIAYALPRKISVVTVSDGSMLNVFPTDLHGPAAATTYVSSLRIAGMANTQVEKYGRIVLSEVMASSYQEVYSLGKNHMKKLREQKEFTLDRRRSLEFNFPLPLGVIRYRELKKITDFDRGIHRIHFYEVLHEQVLEKNSVTLSHIHQYYAQWRIDQGLETKLFFPKI